MKKSIVILIVLVLSAFGLEAKEREGKQAENPRVKELMNRAETCFPPTAFVELDLNNVSFGFGTGGLMWYDGTNQFYEVPKNSGLHSIFAGGLWMGGISITGELKLAALTFGQNGTDYWAGPLTIGDSDEGIDKGLAITSVCQEFDQHFKAARIDAQMHQQWFDLLELVDDGADPSILTAAPFENGYSMPEYFNEWPGNNENPGFNRTLAPFYDRNGNGEYEPSEGDYPGYDITGEAIDCRSRGPQDPIPLFGDETIWWVFNDNGGIHTESTDGKPIQMEVQAQAFAYSTTDEINSMSFYNYIMINRGNQTLTNTYFGQYADTDIGCASDDFIGCDVSRGLGYAYNGDEVDSGCTGSQTSYQNNSPALGIDFFEGPYLDPDGINNPISGSPDDWDELNAIPYPGLGLGYYNADDILVEDGDTVGNTDQVIDNERFGMRKFVYYNNASGDQGDPDNAVEFYNYLTGFWANGEPFTYGGTGLGGDLLTDYNFPNDTDDEFFFGTGGIDPGFAWSEESIPNDPGDRRFFESAGPFTLEPGEFNNITVGIVWTQAPGGVEALRDALFIADDKAQALFDNCFSILNGPKAPGLSVQELDQEVIIYLDPTLDSEEYTEEDAAIPHPDNNYVFEGYKVYQLVSNAVSSADLEDTDKARLVAQVDIQNGIGEIFNYVTIEGGLTAPQLQVSGADEGLQHSFRVESDLFSGNPLVNHQKYYFMAISYGYNNYENYDIGESTGQAKPYIESRLSYTNGTISPVVAVPHKTGIENNGTVVQGEYGDLLPVKRIEGKGSGGAFLEITDKTHDEIMAGEPWLADEIEYTLNHAPIKVKIVDPLRVRDGDFKLRFIPDETPEAEALIDPTNTRWGLWDAFDGTFIASSEQTINVKNEYLLLDYGIAIEVENPVMVPIDATRFRPTFNGATLTFEDEEQAWLDGFRDSDDTNELNWIRAGGNAADCIAGGDDDPSDDCYYNDNVAGSLDPDEDFESVLQGIVAPWILVGHHWSGPINSDDYKTKGRTKFEELNNVNVVFTDNKDLWTRVPVIEVQHFPELAQNGGFKGYPRIALSVDKNGRNMLDPDHNHAEVTSNGDQVLNDAFIEEYMYKWDDDDEFSYLILEKYKELMWPGDDPSTHPNSDLDGMSFGFGWFPGYAIDVETGERLNMAFGENSGLGFDNGADMIWNPTGRTWNENVANPEQNPLNAFFGGMHYIYVFRNEARAGERDDRIISYDNSNRLFKNIFGSDSDRERTYSSISWCMLPKLNDGFAYKSVEDGLIPSDATLKLRVDRPFERYAPVTDLSELPADFFWTDEYFENDVFFSYEQFNLFDSEVPDEENVVQYSENDWFPLYQFTTRGSSTVIGDIGTAEALLDEINVVPNPYYGFSDYENNRLDNRVKIINLPNKCTIKIFNTSGTLVRVINHDVPSEVLDATVEEWDLKNEDNIPISGGTYILHIEAPDLGTKIVKWFGVTRKLDLQNY